MRVEYLLINAWLGADHRPGAQGFNHVLIGKYQDDFVHTVGRSDGICRDSECTWLVPGTYDDEGIDTYLDENGD